MKRLILAAAAVFVLFSSCMTVAEQPSPAKTEKPASTGAETLKNTPPETVQEKEPPLGPGRREEIEQRARNASPELKASLADVALYLDEGCETDIERAWSIFVWISENIAYDTDAFFYGRSKPQAGESVLQSGMAVCAGYSDLYSSLAEIIGLETVSISGHGKGYSYTEGSGISTNHAWTGVRINNEWILIDSTWGAGYVGDDRKYYKKFDQHWFDVDPEVMIFTHLPDDPRFQLTAKRWSTEEYSDLPLLKASVFSNGFTPERAHSVLANFPDRLDSAADGIEQLGSAGFTIEQITAELLSPDFSGFPKIYSPPGGRRLIALNLPAGARLERGSEYTFKYMIRDCFRHAVLYNGEWHFALRKGEEKYNFSGLYDGTVDENGIISFSIKCDKPGTLRIVAQPEDGDSYGGFLEYTVD